MKYFNGKEGNMELLLQNIIELREKYGARALKIEFESEYFSFLELEYLRKITSEAQIDFIIKLGGFSSIKDLEEVKRLKADAVIAPMIESRYAFDKFINSYNMVFANVSTQPRKYINIETKCGIENIIEIFTSPYISQIEGVILGRGDMAHSFEIQDVQDDKILRIGIVLREKTAQYNKKFIVGGQITPNSIPYLQKLNPDGVETRKILFNKIPTENEIISAISFEKNLLKSKKNTTNYDLQRIEELEERLFKNSKLMHQNI